MSQNDIIDWAVQYGDFGTKPRKCLNKDKDSDDQWASSVNFLEITDAAGKIFDVVSKRQPANELIRMMFNSNHQFAVEVAMYKQIVPELGVPELFPKLFIGRAVSDPEKDVIMVEDLSKKGFRLTDSKLFISPDHVRLAIIAVAKFHAASLNLKHHNPTTFLSLTEHLGQPQVPDNQMFFLSFQRAMLPLFPDKDLEIALNRIKDPSFLKKIRWCSEPMGVIAHGDFCRNNVLFRYENDKPVECIMFDLATSLYTSPAIDLAFFLYLNVSPEDRDAHWDSYLDLYAEIVSSSFPKFDKELFLEDFAKKAVYGYYHCSFFQPVMLTNEKLDLEEMFKLPPEVQAQIMASLGGEKGTELLVSIVKHMKDKGYIKAFIESDCWV